MNKFIINFIVILLMGSVGGVYAMDDLDARRDGSGGGSSSAVVVCDDCVGKVDGARRLGREYEGAVAALRAAVESTDEAARIAAIAAWTTLPTAIEAAGCCNQRQFSPELLVQAGVDLRTMGQEALAVAALVVVVSHPFVRNDDLFRTSMTLFSIGTHAAVSKAKGAWGMLVGSGRRDAVPTEIMAIIASSATAAVSEFYAREAYEVVARRGDATAKQLAAAAAHFASTGEEALAAIAQAALARLDDADVRALAAATAEGNLDDLQGLAKRFDEERKNDLARQAWQAFLAVHITSYGPDDTLGEYTARYGAVSGGYIQSSRAKAQAALAKLSAAATS